ncbi:hypothetical protein BH23CHL5_BH23CHL5_26170 [soil metagenome]
MPAPGQIVSTFPAPAGDVAIRFPKPGDAPALLKYIKTVSREQTFILFQGEQLTLEQEKVWLRDRLAEIEAGVNVNLAAKEQRQVELILDTTEHHSHPCGLQPEKRPRFGPSNLHPIE